MTDTAKLQERIELSGLKKSYIAIKLGITPAAFYQKIANKREFKASEIDALCQILGITDLQEKEAIFFAGKVDELAT